MLELRTELINRINSDQAFWYLPDLNEIFSLYLIASEVELTKVPFLIPLKNQFLEFICSISELTNIKAVEAMSLNKIDFFWSRSKVNGISQFYAELPHQFFGMYDYHSQESQDLQKGVTIAEFRIVDQESHNQYSTNQSFPDPVEGYSYYLREDMKQEVI